MIERSSNKHPGILFLLWQAMPPSEQRGPRQGRHARWTCHAMRGEEQLAVATSTNATEAFQAVIERLETRLKAEAAAAAA